MRIACLSAESADLCARLGAWDDVVAVTAYASQEGLAPRPIVSGFSSGDARRVLAHSPDLVITFSDVQADLAAALIRAGVAVFATNQRTLAETKSTMQAIARLIGRTGQGEQLVAQFEASLASLRNPRPRRPRVYFEEWPDPPISGIAWVGDLIELVGGEDLFAHRRHHAAKDRMLTNENLLEIDPEVVFASWCGKPVDMPSLQSRLSHSAAARNGNIFEIPGEMILQPGYRLLEGARKMREIIDTIE